MKIKETVLLNDRLYRRSFCTLKILCEEVTNTFPNINKPKYSWLSNKVLSKNVSNLTLIFCDNQTTISNHSYHDMGIFINLPLP